jgi:hypothetical protein
MQEAPNAFLTDMVQQAVIFDNQPIRAACFNPSQSEYFVLGTNSKCLKFCKLGR